RQRRGRHPDDHTRRVSRPRSVADREPLGLEILRGAGHAPRGPAGSATRAQGAPSTPGATSGHNATGDRFPARYWPRTAAARARAGNVSRHAAQLAGLSGAGVAQLRLCETYAPTAAVRVKLARKPLPELRMGATPVRCDSAGCACRRPRDGSRPRRHVRLLEGRAERPVQPPKDDNLGEPRARMAGAAPGADARRRSGTGPGERYSPSTLTITRFLRRPSHSP